MKKTVITVLILLLAAPLAWSEDGPRTGDFRKALTPIELLGAEGAKAIESIFPLDEKLTWQLSVPKTYDPGKPAGVMVFIGFAEWGSGKKAWTSVLEDQNIIWIGLIGGLDDDRREMGRAAQSYRDAGVSHVDFLQIPNVDRRMPGSSHFEQAVKFLDSREQTSPETE